MRLKVSSAKCPPFCPGGYEFNGLECKDHREQIGIYLYDSRIEIKSVFQEEFNNYTYEIYNVKEKP